MKKPKKQKYDKGGFFKKTGQALGNTLRLQGDLALSLLGMPDVINENSYKGDYADKYNSYSNFMAPIAGAAGTMALNSVAPGAGNLMSMVGQGANASIAQNQRLSYDAGGPIFPDPFTTNTPTAADSLALYKNQLALQDFYTDKSRNYRKGPRLNTDHAHVTSKQRLDPAWINANLKTHKDKIKYELSQHPEKDWPKVLKSMGYLDKDLSQLKKVLNSPETNPKKGRALEIKDYYEGGVNLVAPGALYDPLIKPNYYQSYNSFSDPGAVVLIPGYNDIESLIPFSMKTEAQRRKFHPEYYNKPKNFNATKEPLQQPVAEQMTQEPLNMVTPRGLPSMPMPEAAPYSGGPLQPVIKSKPGFSQQFIKHAGMNEDDGFEYRKYDPNNDPMTKQFINMLLKHRDKSNFTAPKQSFEQGGDLTRYKGNTHEYGGIPLGNTNAEVEHGETRYKDFVFSDSILYPNSKQTIADRSKKIENKYSKRVNDKYSDTAKERELNNLMQTQEHIKQFIPQDGNTYSVKYKNGGMFIKPYKTKYSLGTSDIGLRALEAVNNNMDFLNSYANLQRVTPRGLSGIQASEADIKGMNNAIKGPNDFSQYGNYKGAKGAGDGDMFNNKLTFGEQFASYLPAATQMFMSRKGPAQTKFQRLNPETVNLELERDLLKQNAATNRATVNQNIRNTAQTPASYLAAMITGNALNTQALNQGLGQSVQNEANYNNQILNNANMFNTKTANDEFIANEMNKAAYQKALLDGIVSGTSAFKGNARDNRAYASNNAYNNAANNSLKNLFAQYLLNNKFGWDYSG
jgi:hypothetical protein